MQAHPYRFDIRDDALYKAHPEIRAAFTLAEKAYRGISREKIDPSITYITHPIMVYDLAVLMGVRDPRVLAAALLHDAREDYGPYVDDPTLMRRELEAECIREGIDPDEAKVSARIIDRYVGQMTNAEKPLESKGIAQMMKVKDLSPPVKLIKVADQTASLLCHLIMENAPEISPDKPRHFAQKARDLVSAICRSGKSPKEQKTLARWQQLFDVIYEENAKLLSTRWYDQHKVRADFHDRLDALIPSIGEDEKAEPDYEVRRSVVYDYKRYPTEEERRELDAVKNDDDYAYRFGGVVRVDLNQQGEVVGYVTWTAPDDGMPHVRNYLQSKLLSALRERPYDVRVDETLCEIRASGHDVMEGRYHHCLTPIPARDFAFNAEDNICFDDDDDGAQLTTVARNLERDFWMPETGGASRADSLSRGGNTTRR